MFRVNCITASRGTALFSDHKNKLKQPPVPGRPSFRSSSRHPPGRPRVTFHWRESSRITCALPLPRLLFYRVLCASSVLSALNLTFWSRQQSCALIVPVVVTARNSGRNLLGRSFIRGRYKYFFIPPPLQKKGEGEELSGLSFHRFSVKKRYYECYEKL